MGACCETKGRIEGGSSSHISIHEQKAIRLLYDQHNQGQVFTFFNKLEFSDQQNLMKEAISVDLSLINQLFAEYCEPPSTTKSSSFLNVSTSLNTSNPQNNQGNKPKVPALTLTYKKQEPVQLIDPLKPDIFGFKDQLTSDTKTQMIELGQEMIRDGMVAVIVLAGGQGTRLGFDRSKGEYPVNTPSLKTIFQILLEKFLKAQMNAHNSSEVTDSIQNCKFIVMTNPMNHEETVQFFEFNRYFGVRRDSVIFFEQPILPLVNFDGKIIMDEPNKIALAPNGNGAIYDAINNNFRVKEIINSVDYVQIVHCDNPLNKILDPLFIGYTAQNDLYLCMKGSKKRRDHSFLLGGVFASKNHRYACVDYELVKDFADFKTDCIENLNIFMLKADKLSELCSNAENLSYNYQKQSHRYPYWDFKTMKLIKPTQPNAYKFELNLTDMLSFVESDKFGVLVVQRDDEYAPIVYADNVKKAAAFLKSKTILSPRLRPNLDTSANNDALSDNGGSSNALAPFYQETPITARDLIFRQSQKWLKEAGAVLTNEFAHIEVDTLLSYDGEGLRDIVEGRKMPPPNYIKRGVLK